MCVVYVCACVCAFHICARMPLCVFVLYQCGLFIVIWKGCRQLVTNALQSLQRGTFHSHPRAYKMDVGLHPSPRHTVSQQQKIPGK